MNKKFKIKFIFISLLMFFLFFSACMSVNLENGVAETVTLTPHLKASVFPDSNNVYCNPNGIYNSSDTIQIQNTYSTDEKVGLSISQIALTNNEGKPSGSDYGTWTIKDTSTTPEIVYFSGYIGQTAQTLTTPIFLYPQQSIDLTLSYIIEDRYKIADLLAKSDNDPFGYITWTYDEEALQAYGYKDTTSDDDNTLVITYDGKKAEHEALGQSIYEFPTSVSSASSWGWNTDRTSFNKVTINENFKNYNGLTSTAYMFSDFKSASVSEGFEYLDTSKVTNMGEMFKNYGYSSTTINTVPNVENWNTTKVSNMASMFSDYGYSSTVLDKVPNVSNWTISSVSNLGQIFKNYAYKSNVLDAVPDVSNWNTTNVSNLVYTFQAYGYSSTELSKAPNTSNWNTQKMSNIGAAFQNYGYKSSKLNDVPDVSSWKTSSASNMAFMFQDYGYSSTELNKVPDISSWDTKKVDNFGAMFQNYGYLSTQLDVVPNVTNWVPSNASNFAQLFYAYGFSSEKLTSVPDMSKWETPKLTNMMEMFYNYGSKCVFSELNFSLFNTSKVTNYPRMLSGMKLKSITLGAGWNKDLTSSGTCLTNSSGTTNATWYDTDGNIYEKCSMGTAVRTGVVTYSDTKQSLTSETQQDKIASKTDTRQADANKVEESEPISSVLLNFTSSITTFFNSL